MIKNQVILIIWINNKVIIKMNLIKMINNQD